MELGQPLTASSTDKEPVLRRDSPRLGNTVLRQPERQAKSRIGRSSIAFGARPVTLCGRSQKTTPTIRACE
jgi:hypothetical protein